MKPIMAHRGWSSRAPENTLAAIKLAIDEKWIQSIELDVQLTKDGVPVMIHDFRLERTTNGIGFVKDLSLKELKKLDAGTWYSPKYQDEKIPTLEEVLQLCKGKKRLNLELKTAGNMYKGLANKVVQCVQNMNMDLEVVITSFDHEEVKRVRELTSCIQTGLIIVGNPTLLNEQLEHVEANTISISFPFLTKPFVDSHLAKGRKIVAWTPNSAQEIEYVKRLSGKIEVCTDYPERAL
ncbi:glycerophosphodiester phosphodiesterase [Anaerobacillus alkalidiazotrophicus]|uniref:Glycerophosphodiester phosphodiesterase n=1 Tax=Anaerobacillus alkalidiazotrophicus TaxID=472963 RepID=A0A1S2M7E3_9BACI|nr:glycerophosphodiester phosphodiesterase family protein [Anaerobacillus alkalidiazotrophicus]OIJ18116.1 glycerophosphodiester phosphodiesterase [Anaerobacillus alkalidiazotrophicus]OIJ19595.1 glycerophosphodiester phosphodiesterase [Anaerobacillus alkalidiazotrophicus]